MPDSLHPAMDRLALQAALRARLGRQTAALGKADAAPAGDGSLPLCAAMLLAGMPPPAMAPAGMPSRGMLSPAMARGMADMATAVRNCVEMLGLELPEAVAMASCNPAAFLGLEHELGRIAPGYRADLVLLDDSLDVIDSWIDGKATGEAVPRRAFG